MPGAMVALLLDDRQVLLTKRTDTGAWCLPAGAAEPGGSFATTAVEELMEETGLEVTPADLIPFGCLSEAELHTIRYPNGDVTHCFALCFLARRWQGTARADGEEATEVRFVDLDAGLEPMHPPSEQALGLLRAFLRKREFQVS